jgi:type I restriction enzyme S subunit
MGSDWKQAALLDYYDIRSGLSKPAGEFGSGFPFVSFKDVFYNYFLPSELTQLVRSSEKEQESCSVKRGDVFLTRTSETMNELGMSSVALKDYEHATFNGFSKRLRPKLGCPIFPEFIGYYLRSPQFRAEMLSFSTMSTRASLNNEMIGRLNVSIPPMGEQKCIAWVLKMLDDKIQLNRQTNQTLEQMAQALFKSWFVDFDPVIDNALAVGNPIPEELQARAQRRQQQLAKPDHQPLPDDIRQLFPSEFEETEALGWVPKGWKVIDMTQLVDSVSNTYPLKTVDSVIFLNTGDIDAGVFLHSDYSVASSLPGQAKKSIQLGDILYSEIRPKNKRFAYVNFESDEYVVSTKLMVLRSKGVVDSKFAYFVLTLERSINELQSIAELRSGTFPQITFKELSAIKISIPDNQTVLDTFSKLILDNYYNKHFQLQIQNKDLEKLRDTLLPKLISGELRLPDSLLDSESNPLMDEVS